MVRGLQARANLPPPSAPAGLANGRQTEEALRDKVAALQTHAEIEQSIASAINLSERLDLLLEHTLVHMHGDIAVVFLVEPLARELRVIAVRGARASQSLAGLTIGLGQGAAGWVAEHGQALAVPDVRQDPRWLRMDATEIEGVVSYLAVPLRVGGRVIGVLDVATRTPRTFSAEEIDFLTTLGGRAAIAIENARLFDETQRRGSEFEALYQTTRDLASQNRVTTLLQTVVERAADLLKVRYAHMYVYDPVRRELEVAFAQEDFPIRIGTRLKLGEGMAGQVATTCQPLIVDDYSTWPLRSQQYDGLPFTATLQVPMLCSGELIGVLGVNEIGKTTRKFNEHDVRVLSLFAAQAASAVHNARLFEETRARAAELEAIRQASLGLTSSLDLPSVLDAILDSTLRLMVGANDAHIYLYQDERLVFGASLWSDGRKGSEWAEPRPNGLTYTVARQGMAVIVPDLRVHPLFANSSSNWTGAIIGLPLKVGERVLGVMNLAYLEPRTFSEAEVRILGLLADQAAIAISNAQLHQDVQTSETRYRTLVENIPIGMFRLSPGQAGRFIMTNPAFRRMFGFTSDIEVQNRPASDIFDPQDLKACSEKLLQDRNLNGVELPLRKRDGTPLWGLVTAQVVEEAGAPAYYDCTVLDITARRQAEAELRRQAEEMAAITRVSREITSVPDLQPVLASIALNAAQLSESDASGVYALQPDGLLRIVASYGVGQAFLHTINSRGIQVGEGTIGEATYLRRPVQVPNTACDLRYPFSDLAEMEGIRAILAVPMLRGDEIKGGIVLWRRQPHYFTTQEVAFLQALAQQCVNAIENARLLEETQRRAHQLAVLNRIASAVNHAPTLDELLEVIYREVTAIVPADAFFIALYDTATNEISYRIRVDEGVREPPERHTLSTGLTVETIKAKKPLLIRDWEREKHLHPHPPRLWGTMKVPQAWLSVPMLLGENVIGVFCLQAYYPNAYGEDEERLLVTIADQVAVVIEKARLLEETQQRALEQAIISEVARALNAAMTVREAFPDIANGLRAMTGCERVSIVLMDELRERFSVIALDEAEASLERQGWLPAGVTAASADVLEGRVHLSDLSSEVGYAAERELFEAGYRSRVCLPLVVGERVIGTLNIASRVSGAFAARQLPALVQIAAAVAISIENTRLFEAEQSRRAALGALYDLSRAMADATDFDAILDLVARSAVETLHVTFSRIMLFDGSEFVTRAAYPVRVLGLDLGVGQRKSSAEFPYCLDVLQQNAPIVIRPDEPGIRPNERAELFLGMAQSVCLVPLRVGDRALGILMLGEARRPERESFNDEKVLLAHSIGDQAASALSRAELFAELERAYLQTVLSLANAVDVRDTYTADHAQRLADMALAVAVAMGMGVKELEDLRYGALLHDIGKIGVPDAILQKASALDPDEWEQMRRHPEIGEQIISPIPRLAGAARVVRHHHERYDGSGYPDGLAGESIPLGARVLSVVDAFSAMMDQRIYKEARSPEEALCELKKHAGTQFDPRVVDTFLRTCMGE